jgi:hypothetical protein
MPRTISLVLSVTVPPYGGLALFLFCLMLFLSLVRGSMGNHRISSARHLVR